MTNNRIAFRELNYHDCDKLLEIYSDREAMKYRGSQPMESIDEAKWFVKNQRLKKEQVLSTRKGIELIEGPELIGSSMYRFNESKSKECEIGYSIGRQYWGQGLGKEIVRLLVASIAKKGQVEKVFAYCHRKNLASKKILEFNGFDCIDEDKTKQQMLYQKTL